VPALLEQCNIINQLLISADHTLKFLLHCERSDQRRRGLLLALYPERKFQRSSQLLLFLLTADGGAPGFPRLGGRLGYLVLRG
jgi:hypothetical protein